ncbi:hypothetical protein F4805DRAFT_416449 [Annulohypoxylon moriforme]|nr:hypothetical protein F4805DRAFT_416449 [Annulohypoxylon moriforme]
MLLKSSVIGLLYAITYSSGRGYSNSNIDDTTTAVVNRCLFSFNSTTSKRYLDLYGMLYCTKGIHATNLTRYSGVEVRLISRTVY